MRISPIVIAALVSMLAGALGCRAGTPTRKEVEKQIGEKLSAAAGVAVAVSCPDIELGKDNQCTAKVAGGKQFPVVVSGAKKLKWQADGITFGPKMAPLVVEHLRDKYAFDLPEPKCPAVVSVGETSACVAEMEGVEIRVGFEVKADDAYFTDVTGVVASDKIEPWLATRAPENLRPAKVDCGARVRVSVPDSTLICKVSGPKGDSVDVELRITSKTGDVSIVGTKPAPK